MCVIIGLEEEEEEAENAEICGKEAAFLFFPFFFLSVALNQLTSLCDRM